MGDPIEYCKTCQKAMTLKVLDSGTTVAFCWNAFCSKKGVLVMVPK